MNFKFLQDMDRRDFLKTSALAGMVCLVDFRRAFAAGAQDIEVGKPWKGWRRGQFQIHCIYTGVAESMFLIFPDGTTMLLDCGDFDALARGDLAVPVLPSPEKHSAEWIARYVQRVNPHKSDVDYMMVSHYHSDHAGIDTFYTKKELRFGKEYCLSGFSLAAEYLNFGKAFDRCWPENNDPLPLKWDTVESFDHLNTFYNYMTEHRNMKVEKFKVGAVDQVALLRRPSSYPEFTVRNICGNGRIAGKDGVIKDLYSERKKENPDRFNENGMSLGMIFTYGKFKFYTAGDFSDGWTLPDGSRFEIEDALADVVEPVSVAKINHHGYYSMPARLVSALRPRVFVNNVWDQLHSVPEVMQRLSDHSIYPGERIICPTIFPAERRAKDAGSPWLDTLHPSSYDAGHIVINVEEGGEDYSLTYLTAKDESMRVESVMRFKA